MTARTPRRALAILAASAVACAAARLPLDRAEGDALVATAPAGAIAAGGLRAWVERGDVALLERRAREALDRDGVDPWARMAASVLARRALDDAAEVGHLVALVSGAPDHPLAEIAVARLRELAEGSAPLGAAVAAGLARVQPRLTGGTAVRAREARALGLATSGQRKAAEALWAENGPVAEWAIAGPFGALHALEFDTAFEPERGQLPDHVPGAAGLPPVPTRRLPSPAGAVSLDGEPPGSDLFYLAATATAIHGGDYVLVLRTNVSVRVWIDGAPLLERRAWTRWLPTRALARARLGPGPHHLLLKVARGSARADVRVALARADGAASDVTFVAPAPGATLPVARAGAPAPSADATRETVARLEREVGPEVARLLVAGEVMDVDREGAKALLRDALRSAPGSAPLLALRAAATSTDPTLSDRFARARAATDLDRVLALDPGDGPSRLLRADLALAEGQRERAAELLEPFRASEPPRPRALVARARVARARNLLAIAEPLAEEARRLGADCAALDLLFNLPSRSDAVAKQDEDAEALSRCRGGLEQLVQHRRRRGDLRGAIAAVDELVRLTPASVDARAARAQLLGASGRPAEGADELAALAAVWPRDARIERQRAELLEAAGDVAGARAARERALLLDGGDLALRRALALERRAAPLDEVAEDGLAAIAEYRRAAPAYPTSAVTVLDFGAIEAHPGGAYTERIHTVLEARDERAVDRAGELTIPDGAELVVARTVKRDGTVLEAEPPVGDKRSLSLRGLEPGDFAEWEWLRTVPARGAALPGFTADPFLFRADMPLWRSIYVATAPASVGLECDEHNMERVAPAQDGGRVKLRIARRDVPALLPEPNAPGDLEHFPFVQVGAGARLDALPRAVADALTDPTRRTVEIDDLAREIRASAGAARGSDDSLVRAAYRRVAERVLGSGGFDESASVALSRGRGNRTMVLKAVLAALGVRARIVLVRPVSRDPAPYRFPRADRYPYAVLRVETASGLVWLDPTLRATPYGLLPPPVRDADAVTVPEEGEAVSATRVPAGDPADDRRDVSVDVVVDEDGGATIAGREEYRGWEAVALRSSLEALDAAARRQRFEEELAARFRGPAVRSLRIEGEGDPSAPLVVAYELRVDGWARLERGRAVLDAAILPARVGVRFLHGPERQRPLLVAMAERTSLRVNVRVPAEWRAIEAPTVDVEDAYGAYRRTEHAGAGILVRAESFQLERGRVAPAAYPAFARFARSVDAAQARPMVFERPAARARPPAQVSAGRAAR